MYTIENVKTMIVYHAYCDFIDTYVGELSGVTMRRMAPKRYKALLVKCYTEALSNVAPISITAKDTFNDVMSKKIQLDVNKWFTIGVNRACDEISDYISYIPTTALCKVSAHIEKLKNSFEYSWGN